MGSKPIFNYGLMNHFLVSFENYNVQKKKEGKYFFMTSKLIKLKAVFITFSYFPQQLPQHVVGKIYWKEKLIRTYLQVMNMETESAH